MNLLNPFALVLSFILLGGTLVGRADDLPHLRAAFLHGKIDRETYLDRLVKLRYDDVWNGGNKGTPALDRKIDAINAEMKRHVLPSNADSGSLTRLRVGRWASPRHPYLYRSNHTWVMLPDEDDSPHGHWKIEGNKYYEFAPLYPSEKLGYSIILLDARYFVITDGDSVFSEKRLK